MQWWIRPGPSRSWAITKPPALGSEQVRLRHPARLVRHLAVAGVARSGVAHDADVADEFETRRVGRDDDHAGALVRRCIRVGDGHHDREGGAVGRRREPLLTVDHVVVAVARPPWSRAGAGSIPRSRVRSSRSNCGSRRRRAGGATGPAVRACRTCAGSRRCRRRVPACRTRSCRADCDPTASANRP